MQACLGEELDPRMSKQSCADNGVFTGNKNGVPQNFITVQYLLHAYDISYTTFKRMKKQRKICLGGQEFAAGFYSPYRMYLKQKYAQWMETHAGRNADTHRKQVYH
jgi:hypothetical protein